MISVATACTMVLQCTRYFNRPSGRFWYDGGVNEAKHNPEPPVTSKKEMSAEDVAKLHTLFDDSDIQIWVDGGWGVDALLEKQTRVHGDLDIAIQTKDLPAMRGLLETKGYQNKGERHARPWNYIMKDGAGHEIDIHAITLDDEGNGIYGPPENGEMYPASALTGVGTINGLKVRCISAEDMVKFHSGYELDEKDFHDVKSLCDKFGIALPSEYEKFLDIKT